MIVRNLLLLILASNVQQYAESSRILCVFPTPSKSHWFVAKVLMMEMIERGHEVTMVSTFPLLKPVKNYRDISLPMEDAYSEIMKQVMDGSSKLLKLMPELVRITLDGANATINNPVFQKVMKEESFDLVVIEIFMSDFILGVGAHFGCPIAVLKTSGVNKLTSDYVGNPIETAAVPHSFLGNINPMSFKDRVVNFLTNGGDKVGAFYLNYLNKKYYDSNFPSPKYPAYGDVKRNISLVLLNQHFTQSVARPYVQNMIEVGGLQINQKPSPLPDAIQSWLDGAEHGAIFLSFGTNLKFSELTEEKLNAFINSIAKLKQRVLWKWDTDEMENKPANVMIGKWLPQDDILAHPNMKLFISHGGLGSVAEAKYHGVPIIGIPVYSDQNINIKNVENDGWGYYIPFDAITEDILTAAFNEVLNNPKYTSTVKKLSLLYKDRPQPPLELAAYWLEYVLRHRGAPHMRYQGVDLNFFQSTSLDVIVFLSVLIYVAYIILKLLFKFLIGLICRKKKQKTH